MFGRRPEIIFIQCPDDERWRLLRASVWLDNHPPHFYFFDQILARDDRVRYAL
jgi:hypothetical protein